MIQQYPSQTNSWPLYSYSAIPIRDFVSPNKDWGKGQSARGCKTSVRGALVCKNGGKGSTLSVGGHDDLCHVFLV